MVQSKYQLHLQHTSICDQPLGTQANCSSETKCVLMKNAGSQFLYLFLALYSSPFEQCRQIPKYKMSSSKLSSIAVHKIIKTEL